MEIAFISANKFKIELENKQGKYTAKLLSYFVEHPSRFISTILVGNNVALVIYGITITQVLNPFVYEYVTEKDWAAFIIQTVLSTFIILLTAEFLPKALFRINPNRILYALGIPVYFIYLVFYVPVVITLGISKFILIKILRIEFNETKPVFGRIDLTNFLKEAIANTSNEEELTPEVMMFQNALEFNKVKLRECIVPRNEIIGAEVDMPVEELESLFLKNGVSKIPVYKDTIDTIVGYIDLKDFFELPQRIKEVIKPIIIVPESMPAHRLLSQFLQENKKIAVVVDEFGGTSGIVTIEDIIEEIFGEIEDEFDKSKLIEQKITENEFVFSARIEIDYINEKYTLNIPISDEYETLAGFIIKYYEDIPTKDTQIDIENFNITILSVSDNRIEKVKLKIAT